MISSIVTDIEGTTSSLSFVKDVLFPYARDRIESFLRERAGDAEVRAQIAAVEAEVGRPLTVEAVAAVLRRWIDEDRKATPLKTLQGLLWEEGYRRGDFTGHVYEDAARRLREWHASGASLYVYSSGSVYAQRLLFEHTEFGDMTPLFADYFDTRIGAKREVESYRAIVARIGAPPERIAFLSDVEAELDAARAAGMATVMLVRDVAPHGDSGHPEARDFDDVDRLLDFVGGDVAP